MRTQTDKRNEADETTVRMWRAGKSIAEIAEALGVTTASIRGRAVRLRKAGVRLDLRTAWERRSVERLERIAGLLVATCPWCNGTGSLNPGPVLDALVVP